MQQARRGGFIETADHRVEISARGFGPGRISASKGSTAAINIDGILTQEPDILAMMFGGNTTYPEIIGAIDAANANKKINDISVFVNSPGGEVGGLFKAMDAIRDSAKPVTVIVGDMAASAAYGLASQGSQILASHRSSRVGAIGTVTSFFVDDKEVTLSSDNAPDKAPDVTTDDGVKAVKKELNEMAALLDDGIAAGRNTTVKKVNANFGQGGMVLADEAIARGMIDGMSVDSSASTAASTSARTIKGESTMDLNELMAQHPAVYALALAAGAELERERVSAHLSSGQACGEISIAMKAIQDGVPYAHAPTAAAYANASMKKNNIAASNADEEDLLETSSNQQSPNAPKNNEETDIKAETQEKILSSVESNMGVTAGERDFLYMEAT